MQRRLTQKELRALPVRKIELSSAVQQTNKRMRSFADSQSRLARSQIESRRLDAKKSFIVEKAKGDE